MSKRIKKTDFTDVITDLAHGQVNQQLTDGLSEVLKAVRETGKKGELTLKLTVTCVNENAVVGAEWNTKLPKPGAPTTMFFFDGEDGTAITREDPRQLALRQLAPVPKAPAQVTDEDDDGGDGN